MTPRRLYVLNLRNARKRRVIFLLRMPVGETGDGDLTAIPQFKKSHPRHKRDDATFSGGTWDIAS